MDIKNTGIQHQAKQALNPTHHEQSSKTTSSQDQASVPTGDRVSLSSAALALANAAAAPEETIDTSMPVDQEKVDRMKAQIESGDYEVNAGSIAAKMLNESQE